jgi:hypothetical protein
MYIDNLHEHIFMNENVDINMDNIYPYVFTNTDSIDSIELTNINKKKSKSKLSTIPNTDGKRYFKIIEPVSNPNFFNGHGRYRGSTPKQAASKAYSKYVQDMKSQGQPININNPITIKIKELTRGSKHKIYTYTAKRLMFLNPVEVHINGFNNQHHVTYKYKNLIKKIKFNLI